MNHQDIINMVKGITIYQAMVAIGSAISILTPVYIFTKPIAVAAASTALTQMMIAQGIDPQQFKGIPEEVERQGKVIDEQSKAQTRIESDLATIKNQNQQLLDVLKQQLKPPE